jgi:hypothetical protein
LERGGEAILGRHAQGGWLLALYPEAGEAGGSFRGLGGPRPGSGGVWVPEPEEGRAVEEAARRARGKVRRYCAANGLTRLGTLTYRGEGEHDPRAVRGDIHGFFRALRRGLGGEPLAYVWVPELHRTGHGFHVHFAVGRYVPRGLIEEAWGRGFIWIHLLQGLPVGSGVRREARAAARYLSKYLGKEMNGGGGLNRYDVGQGFQPRQEPVLGLTEGEVVDRASERMGGPPDYVWRSEGQEGWRGPQAVWLSWR